MATLSIYLKASKVSRDGTAPLYLRVSHGRQKDRLVGLGLRLKPAHWNPRRQEPRPNAPGADRVKEALARAVATAQQVLADTAAAAGGSLAGADVEDIRERIERRLHPEREAARPSALPPERTDLLAFGEAALANLEAEGRISTARAYRTALRKAREFVGRPSGSQKAPALPFDAVTPEFVERFRAWLASPVPNGLGHHPNTVHKNVTALARVWRLAERDGLLDRDGRPPADPFRRVAVKRVPTRRDKLSAEEVRAIEEVPLEDPGVAEARAMWVLALYAGGMRFSDVATLRRKHVTRAPDGSFRVAYRMKKTKGLPSLPITGPAIAVLERYWEERGLEAAGPDALVLPLLDGYDLSEPKRAVAAVSSRNAQVNERLKAVQAAAERRLGHPLSAPLTFHLARHSLAGRLLEAGWDVYDIRAVLGHASVRVTEEYLRGFGRPDLDERLKKLF